MADTPTVAVLGLGAAGTALVDDLARRGFHRILAHDVDLALVASVRLAGGVRVEGMQGPALAPVKLPGSSAAAVSDADLVFVATTADAHAAVAREVAQALRPGTIVVLYCGYVAGTLVFRRALAEAGADPDAVTVVETMNTIHLCGTMAPGRAFVSAMKRWVEVTGPAPADAAAFLDRMGGRFPEFTAGRSLLETGLNNPNPIGHVPAATFAYALMDAPDGPATAGVLQFDEIFTDRLRAVSAALDAERLALMAALGFDGLSRPAFAARAYPAGARFTGDIPRFGRKLLRRHVFEDVPCAIVPYVWLGERAGLRMPVARALLAALSLVTGVDFAAVGRTADALGADAVERLLSSVGRTAS
jgi:opine dehydrogenase